MKRNGKRAGLMIVVAAVLLLCTSPLMAQDKGADNMKVLVEKIKEDKKLVVAVNMQLTEKEAKAFWPVYERYQNELFLLRTRSQNLINDYARSYETMTDAAAKKLLDELMAIETLRIKLARVYLPQFRAVLPERRVLRYYQVENKIHIALYHELAARIPLAKADHP